MSLLQEMQVHGLVALSDEYLVRYFSYSWKGTFWNMEKFKDKAQALSYAKIVNGPVFIKETDRLKNAKLVKIN